MGVEMFCEQGMLSALLLLNRGLGVSVAVFNGGLQKCDAPQL